MADSTKPRPRPDVVTLEDLAPRYDVMGGGKRVFGAEPSVAVARGDMKPAGPRRSARRNSSSNGDVR
jgi:hypothetical protein